MFSSYFLSIAILYVKVPFASWSYEFLIFKLLDYIRLVEHVAGIDHHVVRLVHPCDLLEAEYERVNQLWHGRVVLVHHELPNVSRNLIIEFSDQYWAHGDTFIPVENNQRFEKLLVRLFGGLIVSGQPLVRVRPVIFITEVMILFHGADQVGRRAVFVDGRQLAEEDVLVIMVVPAKFNIMNGHIFKYFQFLRFHVLLLDRWNSLFLYKLFLGGRGDL